MAMAKRAAARRDNIQKTAIKECPIRTAIHLSKNKKRLFRMKKIK
jgi:hypothetical protein